MNILEVVAGRGVNGAIVHTLLLSRELAARGHRVTVLCRPGSWIERELAGGPVDVLPSDLRVYPIDELRRIATVIDQRAIDVVHTHMTKAHTFGVLLKWFVDVPVVATAHSRRLQPYWIFNDRVIAVSESVRRFQRRFNRVPAARLRVIPPFVDVDRFAPSSDEGRQIVRAGLGVGDRVPLIGAVGSIFKEKRILELVRAFALVRGAVPEARLLLVGDGPADYVRRVRAEAESLGIAERVIWTGGRDDVPDLMGALDLLVVASKNEAFPLVIIEAMAVGVPVVATNVGGIPESMADGTHGFIVPLGDGRPMVDAIVRLLVDAELRRRFGDAGRRRAVEHFSANAQVGKIEALFDELRSTARASSATSQSPHQS